MLNSNDPRDLDPLELITFRAIKNARSLFEISKVEMSPNRPRTCSRRGNEAAAAQKCAGMREGGGASLNPDYRTASGSIPRQR